MKKQVFKIKSKGFTLIEIIVSLVIISIISVGSVVGVKYVNEKIRISKLNQITDKVVQAAEVYLESNKESYNQLYNNKNGVLITIKTLIKEGLLDLTGTDLKEEDYKNEFVLTVFAEEEVPNNNGCQEISSIPSWENIDKPIYICLNNTNSTTLNTTNNIIQIYNNTGEYVAKGENPNNWVIFPVISDKTRNAYWSDDYKIRDLWRILDIDSNGQMRLIYSTFVKTSIGLYKVFKIRSTSSGGGYPEYYTYNNDEDQSCWSLFEIINDKNIEDMGCNSSLYDLTNNTPVNQRKKDLIEEISSSYKKMIDPQEYNYIYAQSTVVASNERVYQLKYKKCSNGPYKQSIGFLDYETFKKSIIGNKSFLQDYETIIGESVNNPSGYFTFVIYFKKGDLSNHDLTTFSGEDTRTLYCGKYVPVITLKKEVQLIAQECRDGKDIGTKECPYILKCDSCT